jgi:hypothetical protein
MFIGLIIRPLSHNTLERWTKKGSDPAETGSCVQVLWTWETDPVLPHCGSHDTPELSDETEVKEWTFAMFSVLQYFHTLPDRGSRTWPLPVKIQWAALQKGQGSK